METPTLFGPSPRANIAKVKRKRARLKPVAPKYAPMPKTINFSNDMSRQQEAGGSGAYMDPASNTVYIEKGYKDPFAVAHEVGHVMDSQMTDADRARFQMIMGFKPNKQWDSGTGSGEGSPSGYKSPSEWFADFYAAAATNLDLSRRNVSSYATLTPKKLKRMINALNRMRVRYGLGNYEGPV